MELEDLNGLMTLRRFVEVAHHIPGRIRLRFTNRLVAGMSQHKIDDLASLCHPDGSLRKYSLNKDTGSIILEYDAKRLSPELLNQLFGSDSQTAKQALAQLVPIISASMPQ